MTKHERELAHLRRLAYWRELRCALTQACVAVFAGALMGIPAALVVAQQFTK